MSQIAEGILSGALSNGRDRLNELEALELCSAYSIPVARTRLSTRVEDAVEYAEAIGYPVVLKVVAPEIVHKSDVGGVVTGIYSPDGVRRAYDDIIGKLSSRASIKGVLVQEMIPTGTEVIVGLVIDPQFGPVLMFGLGGIFVEVMEDISFRIIPIDTSDAYEMITEIKGHSLLEGARGRRAVDMKSIVDVLLKVSRLASDNLLVGELDLNPVIVSESGSKVADARVILRRVE